VRQQFEHVFPAKVWHGLGKRLHPFAFGQTGPPMLADINRLAFGL